MSGGKRYLLDANVFIEASQKYYAMDICPGFWQSMIRQNTKKRLCSIQQVKDELLQIDDPLRAWANNATETFFKKTSDIEVLNEFKELVNWVQAESQFTPEAKAEFASVADGWVIAYAKSNDLVVVTHEEYAPDVKKKVPIPNVCLEFNVEYCSTYDMLRELEIQFSVRKRSK